MKFIVIFGVHVLCVCFAQDVTISPGRSTDQIDPLLLVSSPSSVTPPSPTRPSTDSISIIPLPTLSTSTSSSFSLSATSTVSSASDSTTPSFSSESQQPISINPIGTVALAPPLPFLGLLWQTQTVNGTNTNVNAWQNIWANQFSFNWGPSGQPIWNQTSNASGTPWPFMFLSQNSGQQGPTVPLQGQTSPPNWSTPSLSSQPPIPPVPITLGGQLSPLPSLGLPWQIQPINGTNNNNTWPNIWAPGASSFYWGPSGPSISLQTSNSSISGIPPWLLISSPPNSDQTSSGQQVPFIPQYSPGQTTPTSSSQSNLTIAPLSSGSQPPISPSPITVGSQVPPLPSLGVPWQTQITNGTGTSINTWQNTWTPGQSTIYLGPSGQPIWTQTSNSNFSGIPPWQFISSPTISDQSSSGQQDPSIPQTLQVPASSPNLTTTPLTSSSSSTSTTPSSSSSLPGSQPSDLSRPLGIGFQLLVPPLSGSPWQPSWQIQGINRTNNPIYPWQNGWLFNQSSFNFGPSGQPVWTQTFNPNNFRTPSWPFISSQQNSTIGPELPQQPILPTSSSLSDSSTPSLASGSEQPIPLGPLGTDVQLPLSAIPGPPWQIQTINGTYTPVYPWQNIWAPGQTSMNWGPSGQPIWTRTSNFSGTPPWPIISSQQNLAQPPLGPFVPFSSQEPSSGTTIPSTSPEQPITSTVATELAPSSGSTDSSSTQSPIIASLPPIFNPGPVIPPTNIPMEENSELIYNDGEIWRPCEVYDVFCIRNYFSKHSKCKQRSGPVPEPLYRASSPVYYPRVNLSLEMENNYYRGLNGRISEFYINRVTDNLVMAVEFKNLGIRSNDTYFIFHRPGREPIVTKDMFNVNYDSLVSTLIIPNSKELQLERSEVYTYVNDSNLRYSVGPNAFVSLDPVVAKSFVDFLADIPANIQEGDLTRSPFNIGNFIQYSICDFGLKFL